MPVYPRQAETEAKAFLPLQDPARSLTPISSRDASSISQLPCLCSHVVVFRPAYMSISIIFIFLNLPSLRVTLENGPKLRISGHQFQ